MTLSRQLGLLLAIVFLFVFAGIVVADIARTRAYLEEQLASHAQDAATSLGLSITFRNVFDDALMMESMVDSIFDPGYYREISIRDLNGKPVVSRALDVRIDGVPGWFLDALPLETPLGEADVMDGWRQRGRVLVRSHPGFAYAKLWTTALDTLGWCIAAYAGALLLTVALLRRVLAPLRAVEAQALAIINREFPKVDAVPRNRELARVVSAMNRMCAKVEDMLAGETGRAERFREEAFTDPLTGLANRRRFERWLAEALSEHPNRPGHGVLLLAVVAGLEEVNRAKGYATGDECLQALVERIRAHFAGEDAFLARIGGTEFAVVLPGGGREEARAGAEAVISAAAAMRPGYGDSVDAHVGVARYATPHSASDLLAEADMALRRAQSEGPGRWHALEAGTPPALVEGAEQWRRHLSRAIDKGTLALAFQPVRAWPEAAPSSHEVLARLVRGDGERVAAGLFMPMAVRLGLASAIDRQVIEKVLGRIASEGADLDWHYAVNLSRASVEEPGFVEWLDGRLRDAGRASCARLAVELAERDLVHGTPGAIEELSRVLHERDVAMGVDHFGIGSPTFGYLEGLKLAYLKIDGSYVRGIDEDEENRFFVASIVQIAHGRDMRVVAESVETQAEYQCLLALGVDGLQGYLIGRPQHEPVA